MPSLLHSKRDGLLGCILISAAFFASTQSSLAAETVTYTYDAKGRLVKVERSGSVNSNVRAEYTLDKAENRTNVTVSGSPN